MVKHFCSQFLLLRVNTLEGYNTAQNSCFSKIVILLPWQPYISISLHFYIMTLNRYLNCFPIKWYWCMLANICSSIYSTYKNVPFYYHVFSKWVMVRVPCFFQVILP